MVAKKLVRRVFSLSLGDKFENLFLFAISIAPPRKNRKENRKKKKMLGSYLIGVGTVGRKRAWRTE
jgi:hypothetical protein